MAQPRGENLTSALPEGVSLRSWTLNNGLLTVDFSSTYGTLSGIDLTLADYSVVLTLTQLEEVETVMITVGGEMLSYRDHQRMTAEDIVSLGSRIVRQKTRCFFGRPGQGSAAFGVVWGAWKGVLFETRDFLSTRPYHTPMILFFQHIFGNFPRKHLV